MWLFKTAERLDKQLDGITSALADINAFNARKKRDKALALLAAWLPDAERFTAQVKTVDKHVESLEQAVNAAEKRTAVVRDHMLNRIDCKDESLAEKDRELLKTRQQAYQLSEQIRKQEALLRKIPSDVLEQLKTKERGVYRWGNR